MILLRVRGLSGLAAHEDAEAEKEENGVWAVLVINVPTLPTGR